MARRCVPNKKKPAWWPEAPRSGLTLAYDPAGLENRLSWAAPPKRVQELRGASSTICDRVPLPQNQRSLVSLARRGPAPRLRPGRTGTEAEALRPACPIPRGREKRATEKASTSRAPRTRPRPGVGRPSNTKAEEGRLKGRRPIPP